METNTVKILSQTMSKHDDFRRMNLFARDIFELLSASDEVNGTNTDVQEIICIYGYDSANKVASYEDILNALKQFLDENKDKVIGARIGFATSDKNYLLNEAPNLISALFELGFYDTCQHSNFDNSNTYLYRNNLTNNAIRGLTRYEIRCYSADSADDFPDLASAMIEHHSC